MIKKILISAGGVIIAAAAVFGVLYLIKPQTGPSTDDTALVLDFSKDYGACSLLETLPIKTALGDVAADLQSPQNMGIVGENPVGEGVDDVVADSQVCVYAFAPGGTLENGYNANNGLMISTTVYKDQANTAPIIEQVRADKTTTELEAPGDAAFYTASTDGKGPGITHSFILQVFHGEKRTTFTIQQPADDATLTEETAQTALLALAESAAL